ncbi:MAG: MMPL family transporter, partial [Actinomycetaceae bacterium UMB1218B]|nr:MMPL family transporter [Actinomycetaceae bacterium UMB1218B]
MSSLLHRVGRWCADHAKRTLAIWAALLTVLAIAVGLLGINLSGAFKIAEAESMTGLEILAERLPQAAGTSEQVLFTASDSNITAHKKAIDEFVDKAGDIDGVALVSDPFDSERSTITDNGKNALVQIQADTSVGSLAGGENAKAHDVSAALDELASSVHDSDSALTVQLGGNIGKTVDIALSATELVGVLIAAIVLLVTFGSLLTAGAPILSAFIGVGVGMASLLVGATFIQINSVTPVLAVMIGLAVGIDYALFIISRAREYLAKGIEAHEAAARANATAGSAVVFAGGTVIVALTGLGVAGIPFLTVMGVSSAIVVGIAVLVALTAVPALLALLGQRATPKKRTRKAVANNSKPAKKHRSFAARWIDTITKIPALTVLVVITILGIATIPATGMRLGLTDNG